MPQDFQIFAKANETALAGSKMLPTLINEMADPLREPALFILAAGGTIGRYASGRLGLNLLFSRLEAAPTTRKMKEADPDGIGFFHFGSGGRIVEYYADQDSTVSVDRLVSARPRSRRLVEPKP